MSRPHSDEEDEVLAKLSRGELDLAQAFARLRLIEGRSLEEKPPPGPAKPPRRRGRLSRIATFFAELKTALFKRPPPPRPGENRPGAPERAEGRPRRRGATFGKAVAGVLLDLAALAIFAAVLSFLIGPVIFKPGFAPGYDSPAHAYVTRRLVEGVQSTGRLPNIDPYWYSGFEITHKLPILSYIPMMAFYAITNNEMLTTRLDYFLLLGAMGLSVYAAVRMSRSGRLNSLAAAVIVPFSAASIAFHWGVLPSLTRYSAFVLFPLVLYNAVRILDGAALNRLALAVLLSLMFPLHPMVAVTTIVWITVYAILRVALERLPVLLLRHFAYAFLFSAVLAAWYILPFAWEEPVWGTQVPRQVQAINSISFVNQLRYLGAVFGAVSLAAIVLRFSRKRLALFLACIFGFIFALGIYSPIAWLIPGLVYPFLTYFASIIGLTYLIFTSASLQEIKGSGLYPQLKKLGAAALVCLVAAAIVLETQARHDFTALNTREFPKYERGALARLRREKLPGRVMPLGYPYVFETLAISLKTGKTTPEGWYSSISPFYLQITYLYDDLRKGYLDAGYRKLRRWNATYLVVTRHFKARKDQSGRNFAKVIADGGYKPVFDDGNFKIYRTRKPAGQVQRIGADTLIIGKFQPVASALRPDSIGSEKSILIDGYNLAELKNYKTVVLYGFSFRNQAKARALLEKYIRSGGRVVVDTQGIDEFAQFRNRNFLGVRTKITGISGRIDLQVTDPAAVGTAKLRPITVPKNRQIIYYRGLDRVFIKLIDTAGKKTRRLPVAGYKKVGRGKVYFVGGNLLFHAFNNRDAELTQVLNRLMGAVRPKAPAASPDVEVKSSRPESLTFTYKANQEWPALISRTYSPHWYARLDGRKKLPVMKMEGLIGLDLPKGNHRVTLWYGRTTIHPVAKTISVLAWISVLLLFFRYVRTGNKTEKIDGGKESE